ncbi:MAG TPA: CAP domain-containing protein [Phycisphaerae bacterium]|nr:CAP domain-containing protein [Phycisphaerae bacterium]
MTRRRTRKITRFECLAVLIASFLAGAGLGCETQVLDSTPAANLSPEILDTVPGVDDAPASSGTPAASELEQLALERVNRARLRPAQEANRGGIAIDEGVPGQIDLNPKPAVALSGILRDAAMQHSRDMLDRDFFAHQNPDGQSPGDRVLDAGYPWTTVGENLAWNGTTGVLDPVETIERQHDDLFIDKEIEGRGHRVTMLHESLREVGIAIVRGSFTSGDTITYTDSLMQTQEYGTSTSQATFVLGVVYDDHNANGQYDFGEGRPGAVVTMGDQSATTNQGGGYVFRISEGDAYTITFETGPSVELTIEPGDANIKVDSIDGSRVQVNLGLGVLR